MRRRVLLLLPCCFVFAMAAPAARADTVLEKVTTTAVGAVPATATVTINDPQSATGLLKVCITSHSAGQLACVTL
jgi:hypothetical protein